MSNFDRIIAQGAGNLARAAIKPAMEERNMVSGLLGSITIASLLAIAPIFAQAAEMMECTNANKTKASADMDKMPAGEKKTMAMKEMTMAKDKMATRTWLIARPA